MPKIRRRNLPPALLQHLLDRIQAREISSEQLGAFAQWLETRSMARTIGLARVAPECWPPEFRTAWLPMLGRAGAAIAGADRDGIDAVRADLDALTGELTLDELPDGFWPVAGALLVNLRNILAALDAVAEAQPVVVPAPALAGAHPRVRSRL